MKLAVVVQRMVPAEVAGVLFTANPVTGARDEVVLDASPGLGEAVVSGLATPDHFVLDKRLGRVKERRLGHREIVVWARVGGGTEQVEGSAAPGGPVLSDRAVGEIARLGAAIERHFGRPQDVEWAWAGGETFIVQSRPITALPESPPHPSMPVRMLSAIFAEMFPIRPYPLDMTTWVPGISRGAVEPLFSLVGVEVPSIEKMFVEEDGVAVRFTGMVQVRPTPRVLLAPARLLWLALRHDPTRDRADPLLAEAWARVRALEKRNEQTLSWDDLLATVGEALGLIVPLAGEIRYRYFPRALLAAGLLRVVLAMLGHGRGFGTLISGVESTTVEANRALEALAGRVRSDPALAGIFARHEPGELWAVLEVLPAGRPFLEELRAFLDRFGHREVVLSTALQPTWRDAPELVLGIVKGFALAEPRKASGRPAWEGARDEVLAHPILSLAPLRAAFLGTLATARCLLRIREDTHFDATFILPVLRRTLLEFGRRMVRAGVLDVREDVFHLKLDELERVGATWPPPARLAEKLRALVARRKERRAALEGKPLFDPRLYQLAGPQGGVLGQGDVLLRGTSGSPGVAEGPVRVVRDSSEFGKLLKGEVLVAPYTNPAWTPLFQRAAAVVVDAGGPASHAAIVAREYGIPAVMATISGTSQLRDGQRVRVDGSRGLVFDITSQIQPLSSF